MKRIGKKSLLLFIPLLILLMISLLAMLKIRTVSITYNNHLIKQILWFSLGFIILFFLTKLNLRKILKYSFYYYLFSVILLILVLFLGKNINGSKAWFDLGFFAFQPSELVKLTLALYLSNLVGNTNITNILDEVKLIFKVLFITLIPSVLVFLEPDTGAIIFYFIIAFVILFTSKVHKWWFIIFFLLIFSLITSFILLYIYNQDLLIKLLGTSFFYRVERLVTFQTESSYQLENALTVIGSASLLGINLKSAILYIPEAPTDFIFAFSIGNFGIITGFIILICYFLIDIFLVKAYYQVKNKKIKLFMISFISLLFFQEVINISMNLGLLPIIGIALPFLSYGGSTMIIYFTFLGLIFNYLLNDNQVYI